MKNSQKGSIATAVLVAVIVLLVIGAGVYFYESKKSEVQVSSINTAVQDQATSNSPCYPNCPGAGMGQGVVVQSQSTANIPSSPVTSSLLVYNQPQGLYSFSYPKGSLLDPNLTLLVGSKGGVYPVPPNVSPDNFYIPSDPQAVHYSGVSLTIYDSVSDTLASLAIIPDSNGRFSNSLLNNGQFTKSSLGNVSGHAVDKYVYTGPAKVQGQILYVINLGQNSNTSLSIAIMATITSKPSLTGNTSSVETIIKSFVINNPVVQSYLQALPSLQAKASDASNISRFLMARTEAETYNMKMNDSYKGFCANDTDFTAIKNGVSPASVSCFDSATAYAASLQLSNGYFCFDSTGRTVQNAQAPVTNTACGN